MSKYSITPSGDFNFIEVALGHISKRGQVLPLDTALTEINKCREAGEPAFRSIHCFNSDFKKHVDTHKSVRGYFGPSFSPFLTFDIDDSDIEGATLTAQKFVKGLIDGYGVPSKYIIVWFSGQKGYHIQLPSQLFGGWKADQKLHVKLRKLAETLARGHNIDTSIYDQKRLLRIGGTRHDVTGRFKSHITTEAFLQLKTDRLPYLGTEKPDLSFIPDVKQCKPIESLEAVWIDILQNASKPASKQVTTVDYQSFDGSFPTSLSEGDGRDNRFYYKARQLRDWGVPAWEARNILELWDGQCDNPLTDTNGENILMDKIRSAYGSDAELDDEGIVVHSGLEAVNAYESYLDNPSASISTGFNMIDNMHRKLRTGEVCVMLGKTGSGKTALALNMLRNMALNNHRCIFFSLEMTLHRVVERQIAIELNKTADEVEKDFASLRKQVHHIPWWSNYHICSQSAMSMKQIEDTVQRTSAMHGDVDVLCIDYLGLIRSANNSSSVSSYSAVSEIASALKNVAKRCGIAIIVLAQVGRQHGQDGDVPLTLTAGRDSGVIEEGADLVLGVHRPELGAGDRTMGVQVLKSRKGTIHASSDHALYPWHGPSFRVQNVALDRSNLGDKKSLFCTPIEDLPKDSPIKKIITKFDGENA